MEKQPSTPRQEQAKTSRSKVQDEQTRTDNLTDPLERVCFIIDSITPQPPIGLLLDHLRQLYHVKTTVHDPAHIIETKKYHRLAEETESLEKKVRTMTIFVNGLLDSENCDTSEVFGALNLIEAAKIKIEKNYVARKAQEELVRRMESRMQKIDGRFTEVVEKMGGMDKVNEYYFLQAQAAGADETIA